PQTVPIFGGLSTPSQRVGHSGKILHTRPHIRYAVVPVMLIFHRNRPLETLSFHLVHHPRYIAHSSPPMNIVRFSYSKFVHVFEVKTDQSALHFSKTLYRIQARTNPMTYIRTHSDQLASTFQ